MTRDQRTIAAHLLVGAAIFIACFAATTGVIWLTHPLARLIEGVTR